jgi:hypothetical protein
MKMDAAAVAAAATHPTTVECSAIDQVTQPSVQSTATVPALTVLSRGKKEMTPEARAVESKKRAARRQVAKQKEKDRKATAEKVRKAKMLQAVHARSTAEALAKQATVHAVAMLKSEVVTLFAGDQFGFTANSVSSAAGWQRPASPTLSSTHKPPSQLAAPSRLGVPAEFVADSGAFQPIIDLNRTPVAGDVSSEHNKAPRARATDDLPDAADLFGQMSSQPMFDEVLPLVLCFGPLASV